MQTEIDSLACNLHASSNDQLEGTLLLRENHNYKTDATETTVKLQ